jgi:hypothetical protein
LGVCIQSSTVNKYDCTLPAFCNGFYQPESSTVKLNSEDLTELNQHADRLFDMDYQPIKIQFKDLFDTAFEQIMNLFQ